MNNINQRVPTRSGKGQKKGKNKNDPLKVVYISSPMKVKTSASRFRSLVQQLTGKNSDISEYMEGDYLDQDEDIGGMRKEQRDHMDDLCRVSPASSDSLVATDHNVFTTQIEEQFSGIFKSSYLSYNPPHMDVLGTYEHINFLLN